MACCLEVVLFSYSSQRTFPWIINIFKLASFYFFKVFNSSSQRWRSESLGALMGVWLCR